MMGCMKKRTEPAIASWLRAALRWWFRIEVIGGEHLRTPGPVVFASNHQSFVDGWLLAALLGRECRVAMHARPPAGGALEWLERRAPFGRADIEGAEGARDLVRHVRGGGAALVFPEGRPSAHGGLMKVYPEAARLIASMRAPVVPIHLDGPELSRWSPPKPGFPRRWRPCVRIHVGAPIDMGACDLDAEALRDLLELERFRALGRCPTIPEALADTARRLGGSGTAIEDPLGNRLSLGRIAIGAAALGPRIRRRTDPGEVVGVLLPGVATMPAVLAALWREGRVPALLNPTLGPGPALAALRAAGIRRVLSAHAFVEQAELGAMVDRFGGEGVEFLWTEELRAEIGPARRLAALLQARTPPPARSGRDTPAAVLFTSGTEGTPKAVVLSHGNLLANVAQLRARTDVGPADRVLSALPLFHALGLTGGLLFPLVCGAPIMIYPTPLHYKVIPELAYAHRATIVFGTDTFLAGWGRRADPHDFAWARAAIAGAEPVKPSTRQLWVDRFGVRILEGYGATEASPVLALNTPAMSRFDTVGRFLPALETRLEPVPGIPGQRLWVRGPNVMLGYMLAEKPGVLQPLDDGWYDTGDAVTVDTGGFVTLAGRIKRFAKVGGEMVSLAAVERLAAATWPDADVAAVSLPDARKGERVILAVTGEAVDRQKLAAKAREQGVGEILLPAELRAVAEIPLLASGKPDYPALKRRLERAGESERKTA